MRLSHDEVKEVLADYLKGALPEAARKEVEAHLKECDGCTNELSFLREIVKIDVPDPGDLFWQSLPGVVRMAVKKKEAHRFSLKSILFRPLPVAAAIAVLVLLVIIFANNKEVSVPDPLFRDPFEAAILEYDDIDDINDISGKELSLMTAQLADNELSLLPLNSIEYSYNGEFDSLSSTEMNRVHDALDAETQKGG